MRNAEQLEEQLGHRAHPLRRQTDTVTTSLYPYQHGTPSDEVSLVDLWLVLMRRKWIVAGVLVLCIIAAGAAVLLQSHRYEIRTGIEIGAHTDSSDIRPVESPEAARARLENTYIPLIEDRYRTEDIAGSGYEVKVSVPGDTNLLMLESTAPGDRIEDYQSLHREIVDRLAQDHERRLAVMKQRPEGELVRARLQLEALKDGRTLEAKERTLQSEIQQAEARLAPLTEPDMVGAQRLALENRIASERQRLERLDEKEQALQGRRDQLNDRAALLREQIAELSDTIREARAARLQAVDGATGEARVSTRLAFDNEIQQDRNRLAALEERLHDDLSYDRSVLVEQFADLERRRAEQRHAVAEADDRLVGFEREHTVALKEKESTLARLEAQYDKMLADHERAIRAQEQTVTDLEARLANFVETRTVIGPKRSNEPVGTSPQVILLLGAVLGLMLGVFAAFFAEFLGKAREVQRAREG